MPSPRWQPGVSGNPAGRQRGSRNRLSEAVICALLRDFSEHGAKAVAEVRRTQPAAYLKVLALLIPREHKVEHFNPLSHLSDEQLADMIADLEERIGRRAAGGDAKLIEGEAVETTALPTPAGPLKLRRPSKVIEAAETAIGPRERKPRKRVLPLPGA